jgi:hypothetical protein
MSPGALSSATVIIRKGSLSEAAVDEEIVAFSIESGAFAFNPVGSRIWQLLAGPISVGEICRTLVTEYEVDSETCEWEVLKLVEELWAEGMVGSPANASKTL